MAPNFKVVMTALALISMKNIYDYIERCTGDAYYADSFSQRTTNFINNVLPYSPFMGRIPDDEYLQKKKIRRVTTHDKKYNIFYYVDEQSQTIYIMKVANGRQSNEHQLFGL